MSSGDDILTLSVSFRGTTHNVTLSATSTLSELHEQLEELTTVPPSGQKLLYKGKKSSSSSDASATLQKAGLKNGMKVQLLGSTPDEMSEMQKAEVEKQRKDRIMADRARKGPTKTRSTTVAKINPFVFHSVAPLPHLPHPDLALSMLQKLASDPAILHIMSLHRFSIGLLTELAPHEHPNLLGLNENRGEKIKLRLRTDGYDGLRNYRDVRRVLCHELTHCVWGDHDNNFKELNSLLNRQVAEYEADVKASTHTLSSYTGPAYDPSTSLGPVPQGERLGGDFPLASDEPLSMRERILTAALKRRDKEDEEIEEMCGNAPRAGSGDAETGH